MMLMDDNILADETVSSEEVKFSVFVKEVLNVCSI